MTLSKITTSPQLVSVIMPAYNASQYIREAIQSMLSQSYSHWELLIIDDASTDNTTEVVAEFLADSRIHYQKVARIGHPAGVRNLGIQKAQGKFIAFLDADDLFEPEALSLFIDHMIANPECSAVYGFLQKVTENGKPIPDETPFLELGSDGQYAVKADYSHTWKNILTSRTIHQMCFMVRAELFNQIGLFNEAITVGEDFSFYVRMFIHHFEGVQFVPRYVYRYRQYSASISNSAERFDEILRKQELFFQHLFNELPIPQEALAYRSEFIGRLYGYYARTRYNQKQTNQLRACVKTAWEHPDLKKSDWFKYCASLAIRSSLGKLDGVLTRCYWFIRAVIRKPGLKQGLPRGLQS